MEEVRALEQHLESAAHEEVAPLAPDEAERHPLTALDDEAPGGLDDVGVEAAGQPFVAGDDDEQRAALGTAFARLQQRMDRRVDPRRDARQHSLRLNREGPRAHDALL